MTSDVALSLQHASVYTLGKRANALADLRSSPEAQRLLRRGGSEGDRSSSPVVESPRGGQATWHGPGQAVLYPVLLLRGTRGESKSNGSNGNGSSDGNVLGAIGVRRYMEELENALVSVSRRAGVADCVSGSAFGSPGAWVVVGEEEEGDEQGEEEGKGTQKKVNKKKRKIGAVGVRVSRGVATHGAALNVNPDLRSFDAIVPCGDEEAEPTSIEAELTMMRRRSRSRSRSRSSTPTPEESLSLDVSKVGIELAEELASRLGFEGGIERVEVAELKRELREHGYEI